MKRITIFSMLLVLLMVFTACGAPAAPASAPAEEAAAEEAAAPAELPFEVAEEAINPLGLEPGAELEGVFFEGGFGRGYLDNAADIYRAVHPDNPITVEGIQRVGEVLRPRFIAGDPPDVIDNSGAGALDRATLVAEDQMLDLAPLMNAPALDSPGMTFGETLFPGSQENGVWDGVQRELVIALTVFGVWHSETLFEENGWEYPQTWDEMLEFSEARKAEGVSPWTYQGKFPQYMVFGVFYPLVYKNGGIQAVIDMDNLEDGAWENPAVVEAAKMMEELHTRDLIMPGTEGLTHTEAQAEWLQGNAIFIPSGSWLENEMRELTPDDFGMVVKPVPGQTEDVFASLLVNAGEEFFVPSAGTNPEGGMEYLRALMSKENAKYMAENVGVIVPVAGGTEGIELSSALDSALAAVEAAGEETFTEKLYLGAWYPDLRTELKDRMGDLLTGRMTADEFIAAMQETADETKADPEIPKYSR